MNCPYCQAPSFETQPECAQCSFSLERVEQYFGALPRLQSGISDLALVLSNSDSARIVKSIATLRERLPQITFSVVTTELAPHQPLAAYAFWIFNRGICRDLDRGGRSRDMLLTLDVASARANLMVGYGLEPFVGSVHLQEMVNTGAHAFSQSSYAPGICAVISKSAELLEGIASSLGRTFGLDMAEIRRTEDPRQAVTEAGNW